MLMIKIVSLCFAALLLYPVARTFYKMCVFERPPETEERSEGFPPPTKDDSSGPSFVVMVSQTYYAVSPFERLNRFIGFGPRKWVGFVGFSATILTFFLLAYSAIFPLKGASHSYEWKEDFEGAGDSEQTPGAVIFRGEEGAVTLEPNPDEGDQATAGSES